MDSLVTHFLHKKCHKKLTYYYCSFYYSLESFIVLKYSFVLSSFYCFKIVFAY